MRTRLQRKLWTSRSLAFEWCLFLLIDFMLVWWLTRHGGTPRNLDHILKPVLPTTGGKKQANLGSVTMLMHEQQGFIQQPALMDQIFTSSYQIAILRLGILREALPFRTCGPLAIASDLCHQHLGLEERPSTSRPRATFLMPRTFMPVTTSWTSSSARVVRLSSSMTRTCRSPRPSRMYLWRPGKATDWSDEPLTPWALRAQALVRGLSSVHWYRVLILEARGLHLSAREWHREVAQLPFICVTDSKSLYDTICKCTNPASQCEDKRTSIDISLIKQEIAELNGRIRWIDGRTMLADSLTRESKADLLRHVMKTGQWSILAEGSALQRKLLERTSRHEVLFIF